MENKEMVVTVNSVETGVARNGGKAPPGKVFATTDSGSEIILKCWQAEEKFTTGNTYSCYVFETTFNNFVDLNVNTKMPVTLQVPTQMPMQSPQIPMQSPQPVASQGQVSELQYRDKSIIVQAIMKSLIESGKPLDVMQQELPHFLELYKKTVREF